MPDLRLIVAGAGGRMGRTLIRLIAEMDGVALAGAVEQAGSALLGRDAGVLAGLPENGIIVSPDIARLAPNADAVLDFTAPAASVAMLQATAGTGLAHVVGTTGFTAADEAAIRTASSRAAIVKSGNMSLGVNLLAALVERVAASLDEEFDIEILEMHHSQKVDAPSGTALLLGRAVAGGRAIELADRKVMAREGHTGARRPGQIGFATLRGGTVVGDHSVIFAGPGERLELAHRAEDRTIFARGAVKAARWAHGRKPGLYSMADVLGLGAAH